MDESNSRFLWYSEIISRLQHILRARREDGSNDFEGTLTPQQNPGMCLNDIMSMWESKVDIQHSDDISVWGDAADADDLDELDHFDGLGEANIPNFAEYRQILADSLAYRWLQSSVRAQSVLHIPGRLATTNNIREQILKTVRSSSGFSRSYVQEIELRLELDWDPFLFAQEQQYPGSLAEVLGCAITLTGHGNEVQAATCNDYVNQVWPETGRHVLRFLQDLIAHQDSHCQSKSLEFNAIFIYLQSGSRLTGRWSKRFCPIRRDCLLNLPTPNSIYSQAGTPFLLLKLRSKYRG